MNGIACLGSAGVPSSPCILSPQAQGVVTWAECLDFPNTTNFIIIQICASTESVKDILARDNSFLTYLLYRNIVSIGTLWIMIIIKN
jgi:hypothetical protein